MKILHKIVRLEVVDLGAAKFMVLKLSKITKYLAFFVFYPLLGYTNFCIRPLLEFFMSPSLFPKLICRLPTNIPSSATTGYSPAISSLKYSYSSGTVHEPTPSTITFNISL